MNKRIIAVDDERDFLESVRRGLGTSGFKNVTTEDDPRKAVTLFETGKDFDFEPLKAADRRIIHLAVSELNDVATYTIGDGLLRKVVITPKTND